MGEELEKELAEMLGDTSTKAPSTEIPNAETEAPSTEIPKEKEDEEVEVKEDEEVASLKARIAELENLESFKKDEKAATEAPTTEAPIEEINFVDGVDMEELTSNPKVFNEVLNKVFKKGVEKGSKLKESVLLSVPNVIKYTLTQQTALEKATAKFYADNADLNTPNNKKIVALIAEKIVAKNPQLKLEEILEKTEKEVRVILNLKKQANSKKEDKPDFGKKPKGDKAKPAPKEKLSELQKELNDMIEATEL